MKKLTLALILAVGLIGLPSLTAAQEPSFFEQLISSLRRNLLAAPADSSPDGDASVPSSGGSSGPSFSAPSGSSGSGGSTTNSTPNSGAGCPSGATMPAGVDGQTIRCEGGRWVADSNLVNDGEKITVGGGANVRSRLYVDGLAGNSESAAITGRHNDRGLGVVGSSERGTGVVGTADGGVGAAGYGGIGVFGSGTSQGVYGITGSPTGVGVLGRAIVGATAVKAQQDNSYGYGFYQEGLLASNVFEGRLSVPTIKITGGAPAAGKVLTASDETGSAYWSESSSSGGGWSTSGTNIYSTNTGNVGIGTTGPVQKLDVRGAIRAHNPNANGAIELWHGTSAGVVGTISDTPLQLRTNNLPQVVVTNTGNLGVGTDSPAQKLDVKGVIRAANENASGSVELWHGSSAGVVGTNSNTSFQIRTNNVPRVEVGTNGVVAISGRTDVGSLKLIDSGSRPACTDGNRGLMWFDAGSGSEDDHLYFCMRRNGSFQWLD